MSLMTSLPSPESRFQTLLREARNGSEEARWLVVQLFRTTMLSIANRKINGAVYPREAPSDIVQETIIEAERDLDYFDGLTEAEMRAWLRQVLERNLLNVARKYRTKMRDINRERPLESQDGMYGPSVADPGPSPSTVLDRRETSEALELAIRALPEHFQQVILLRYRRGLSYEEIAHTMGKSEMATRKLWSRALHELSGQLNGYLR